MPLPFLNKIFPKKIETEYFLALEICLGEIKLAIAEVEKEKLKILKTLAKKINDFNDFWEEVILTVDEVITQTEEEFSLPFKIERVILGLPREFLQEDKIEKSYLTKIKELCEKLSLKPLGFVEITAAVESYLKQQEGGPQSLILIRVDKNLEVTLIQAGRILNQISILKTENIAQDIEKVLNSFSEVEILPSRIVLYNNGEEADKIKEELINYPWTNKAAFLHFPKIEIFPWDFDIKAIVTASANEIIQRVETVEKVKNDEGLEDFGFEKDKDILEEQPSFSNPQLEPSSSQVLAKEPRFILFRTWLRRFFENFKDKIFGKVSIIKKKTMILLIGIFFLLIGSGLIFSFLYFPVVKVNLFPETKIINEKLEVVLNPKITTIDEAKKEIPFFTLELEKSGIKKEVTTGKKTIGEPAKGEVVIYNKTANNKVFSKGTVLIAPNNFKFTLDEEITVASATESIGMLTFGKQNAKVTAQEIGPEGNLGVNQEFRFVDLPTSSYSARNEIAFSGGTKREISVVTRQDQERLIASLTSELNVQAQKELEEKIREGEKIIKETFTSQIIKKKFDKEPDQEGTEISLEVSMKFKVMGYKENDLLLLLEKTLHSSLPAGFEFRSNKVKIENLEIEKQKDGSILLKAVFSIPFFPKINEEEIKKQLVGKDFVWAENYLRNLGTLTGYEIKFIRNLPIIGRKTFPFLSRNIRIETLTNRE